MIKSGIYKITNLTNRMFYIGSSQNVIKRWIDHRSFLNTNRHENEYLQNAWNKYGEVNFELEILEVVVLELLEEREQYWLDSTKCCDRTIGYNLSPSSENCRGFVHTEATRAKLSALKKGKPRSEETKAKISASMIGRQFSEETRAKMRTAQLGKKKSEEFKEMKRKELLGNQINKGRVQSEEHIEKRLRSRGYIY